MRLLPIVAAAAAVPLTNHVLNVAQLALEVILLMLVRSQQQVGPTRFARLRKRGRAPQGPPPDELAERRRCKRDDDRD